MPKIPDGRSGEWAVETFEITDEGAKFENLRASFKPGCRMVYPGTYQRLTRNGHCIMSDTNAEKRDYFQFVRAAKGNVLINGLGLGIVLSEILQKESVERVTVIEKSPDVFALVALSFTDDPRVTIIFADAFTWKPPKGERYNAVWHDIWDDITADNLPEMRILHRKYGRKCDWQGSWCRALCEEYNRRNKRWRY